MLTGTARAEGDAATRGAARDLGTSGVEAYQNGDYATATARLEKAYKVLRVPTLGLWSARALAKSGKLVEASERYLEVTRLEASSGDVKLQKQAQVDATDELEQLRPRVPTLIVEVRGAQPSELKLTLDGAPLEAELLGVRRPTNPGKHEVVAEAGGRVVRATVELEEGKARTVTLDLGQAAAAATTSAPSEAPPPASQQPESQAPSDGSGQRTLGYVLGGVGIAGLGVGVVFNLMARSTASDADSDCSASSPSGFCNVATNEQAITRKDNLSSAETQALVSYVGLGVGAAALATGVVLFVTAGGKRKETTARVTPLLSPGQLGLSVSGQL